MHKEHQIQKATGTAYPSIIWIATGILFLNSLSQCKGQEILLSRRSYQSLKVKTYIVVASDTQPNMKKPKVRPANRSPNIWPKVLNLTKVLLAQKSWLACHKHLYLDFDAREFFHVTPKIVVSLSIHYPTTCINHTFLLMHTGRFHQSKRQ